MKSTYYFVYCRKTRNQVSLATRYYKLAKRTREKLNNGNSQYALGHIYFSDEYGITRIGRGKINLFQELLPTRIRFSRRCQQ